MWSNKQPTRLICHKYSYFASLGNNRFYKIGDFWIISLWFILSSFDIGIKDYFRLFLGINYEMKSLKDHWTVNIRETKILRL